MGGSSPRGVTCVAHVFTAHIRADPGLVWTALTDPGQSTAYLYGLAAHSTWTPGDPVELRLGDRVQLTGLVLCVQDRERLSYLLSSGPDDPPVYLAWLLRSAPGGCAVRLEVDEVEHPDSAEDAEDLWLPILAALQALLAPG